MDVEMLDQAADISNLIKIITSWGFLILVGTVISMFITQLIKVLAANTKIMKYEKAGDFKKLLSLVVTVFVAIPIGYVQEYNIIEDSRQYIGIWSGICSLASIFYRYGFRLLFNKMEFNVEKAIENKEAKIEAERG